MAFEESLKALKAKELQEAARRQAREEEQKRIEEEEEKRRTAETERLLKIVEEKLSPTFELVNEVYLEGRGVISLKKVSMIEPSVSLELDWDRYDTSSGNWQSWGGKTLKLILSHDLGVKLRGAGRKSETEFSLNAEDWEQHLKQGIYSILKTPGATHWHESYLDRSR